MESRIVLDPTLPGPGVFQLRYLREILQKILEK